MQFKILLIFLIIMLFFKPLHSQDSTYKENITDIEKPFAKYLSWSLLQIIPSSVWISDNGLNQNSLNYAFRWNVTPVNISFSTNKYVSPVQFIFVNPMRKYTGSLEFFVQPEWVLSSMDNSGYKRFGLGVGSRINIPVKNYGEHLYVSIGGKYNFRKNEKENKNGYYGLEAGVYALFGIIGLQFNYNFDDNTKYNFGINFKYW